MDVTTREEAATEVVEVVVVAVEEEVAAAGDSNEPTTRSYGHGVKDCLIPRMESRYMKAASAGVNRLSGA